MKIEQKYNAPRFQEENLIQVIHLFGTSRNTKLSLVKIFEFIFYSYTYSVSYDIKLVSTSSVTCV